MALTCITTLTFVALDNASFFKWRNITYLLTYLAANQAIPYV